MRVAGTILSLSLLVSAAPAFAQGGSYYDRNNWYNRQSMSLDGYGYVSPQQEHLQSRPTYPGDWQQQSYGQQNYERQGYGRQSSGPYWQTQPGSMQQGIQSGFYPPPQMGSSQTGRMGQSPSAPVSSATQGQIKSSLESSGFKNVTVLPQSYLIRATAPDGSQVLMQLSSEGLFGVAVNSTDQASSGGTTTGGTSSGSASTGGTGGSSTSGGTSSSSTGGTSGTGTASTGGTSSDTGNASTGGTGGSSTSGGTSSSTGGTSGTGSTSGGTSSSTGGTSSTGTANAGGKGTGTGQTTTR
jgi:hypothetical protein